MALTAALAAATVQGMAEMTCDVLVVGAGNAALAAALAAREAGAGVVVLERAPEAECGGNSRFTAGAIRTVYDGVEDLRKLIPDLTQQEIARTDFGAYTREQFYDDMARVTQYRANPDLVELLVERSLETLVWLRGQGVKFLPAYGRQAFKSGDKTRFWGGLTVEASGGGPGLVEALHGTARHRGIDLLYGARAQALHLDERRVRGVAVRQGGRSFTIAAKAVVLACGGFEANAEWRTRYLGPGWDLAKVRGTRFNTGPFGIIVNARGERFVDEGADFRNYTYAKYGRIVLEQPGQFAWQVFDGKVLHLLRDEYRIRQVTKARADTLGDLAGKLEGVDRAGFLREVEAFNRAIRRDVPFDPTVKDGRDTTGLKVPKSNWANPIDTPPFEAYQVTCGITFTFGGLRIDSDAAVIDTEGERIPGLYAAGELVGGIFYFNYPGGTGLLSGAVFGRIAGTNAGKAAAVAV
jgi:tricarballylate dehydrogenase